MTQRNVLWLSRHAMTPEQEQALRNEFDTLELVILQHNMTFPADSVRAVEEIVALAEREQAHVVAGVFPAHVAARFALRADAHNFPMLALPVSVPAPAKEGEVRGGGFTFSHWEIF